MKRKVEKQTDAEILFHQYNDKVFGYVLNNVKDYSLAKDITQDIFLKVCLNETRIQDIHDVSNYIFLITRNTLIDHFRRAAHETKYRQSLKEKWLNPIQQVIDKNHYGHILETALDQLSPRQKDVYILHRKEGKTLKEVSRELNISFHTVKNHLAEARKNLRELIDPDVLYIIMVMSMVGVMETVY